MWLAYIMIYVLDLHHLLQFPSWCLCWLLWGRKTRHEYYRIARAVKALTISKQVPQGKTVETHIFLQYSSCQSLWNICSNNYCFVSWKKCNYLYVIQSHNCVMVSQMFVLNAKSKLNRIILRLSKCHKANKWITKNNWAPAWRIG